MKQPCHQELIEGRVGVQGVEGGNISEARDCYGELGMSKTKIIEGGLRPSYIALLIFCLKIRRANI